MATIAAPVKYLTARQIAGLCVGDPSHKSVNRWATHGVIGPDGSLVKLRSKREGGRRLFTREWLEQFNAKLNGETT